ncbi:MAG: hypothetical protein ABI435_03555 [Pseudolysinimonas sp.]
MPKRVSMCTRWDRAQDVRGMGDESTQVRRPVPLPAELGQAFSVSAALDIGVGRDRLRARDVTRHFTGGRVVQVALTTLDLARALSVLLEPEQYFSHLTAAEFNGMRLPEGRRPTILHVTYENAHRAMRRPDVVGHKTKHPVPVIEFADGLRVSNPVAAWTECSSILSVDDLVAMGDGLVRRKAPQATLEDLARTVAAHAGRRGAARLRAALPHIRPETDSARETRLRLAVARSGFPEPTVNGPLVDRRGAQIARGDLVFESFGVVLEYEGRQHADDPHQFAIDIRRLDEIAEAGYRVIRVDRVLLARPDILHRKIHTALTERGWHP